MPTLSNEKPTIRDSTTVVRSAATRKRRVRIITALLLLAILITLIPMGYPEPIIAAVILALPAFMVWRFKKVRSRSRTTEEQMDAEWRERKALEDEMEQIADEAFAARLIGVWRERIVSYPRYGSPKVHRERDIELRENGTGIYRWADYELDFQGQTEFAYASTEKNVISVRLRSIPATDLYRVPFRFEARKGAFGKMELHLCFDADNPLPADLKTHWPFDQDFLRIK